MAALTGWCVHLQYDPLRQIDPVSHQSFDHQQFAVTPGRIFQKFLSQSGKGIYHFTNTLGAQGHVKVIGTRVRWKAPGFAKWIIGIIGLSNGLLFGFLALEQVLHFQCEVCVLVSEQAKSQFQ